ncbi:MAG TPA: hypothetical protein VGQ55_13970, partial [Pyrinomonadaceae bacterium]|nr:hypothetical protein [Pyrinomonadaceae bacterium]
MRSTEWQEIKKVFSAAFDLPEADRPGFLSNYDTHLRVEVEKLLLANDTAEDFIEEPAIFDAGLLEKTHLDPLIGAKIDDYAIVREIG